MAYDSEITPKARDLVVLERARTRIVRDGWWCDGKSPPESGGRCMWLTIVDELPPGEAWRHVSSLLCHLGFGADISEVYRWNDAPGRTKAEVLARFDAAIAKLGEA